MDEYGDDFEGDMIIDDETIENLLEKSEKNAPVDAFKVWPTIHIPYVIDGQFAASQEKQIEIAMAKIHNVSCVSFIPRTTENSYVNIIVSNDLPFF